MPAPIALFVYNRPEHTRAAVEALRRCDGASSSDLVVFSDAPRNAGAAPGVKAVRELIGRIEGFRSVELVLRPKNLGSAGSVSDGVVTMLRRFGRAVFIEDDLIAAPTLLAYFDTCLDRYVGQTNILAICGYSHPRRVMPLPASYEFDIYFSSGFFPWGWAAWERSLAVIDWQVKDYQRFLASPSVVRAFARVGEDLPALLAMQQQGKLDDWVLPLTFSQFRNHHLTVSPVRSLIDNIGHDGSGLHCHNTKLFRNELSPDWRPARYPDMVFVDDQIMQAARAAHSQSLYYKARRRVVGGALRVQSLVRQLGS